MKKRNVLVCTIMTVAMLLQSFVCVTAFAADEPAPLALWDMSEIGKDGYSGTEAVVSQYWTSGTDGPKLGFSNGKAVYNTAKDMSGGNVNTMTGDCKILYVNGNENYFNDENGIYTFTVPFRLESNVTNSGLTVFGGGITFGSRMGSAPQSDINISWKGGIICRGTWIYNNGAIKKDTDYILAFVYDNTGSTTNIHIYLNGSLIKTITESDKKATLNRLELTVSNTTNEMNIILGNAALYKGNYYQSLSITAPTDHPSYVNRPYSGSTSVTFTSGDADENAVWSLDKAYEGVSMDSKTGVLTVTDSAKLGRIKVILSSPLASKTAEYSYRIAEADMNPIAAWYMSDIGKDGYSGAETVSSWGTNQPHSFSGGKLVYASELGGNHKIAFTTGKSITEDVYTVKVPVRLSGALETVRFYTQVGDYEVNHCIMYDAGTLYNLKGWVASGVFAVDNDYEFGLVFENPADTNGKSQVTVYLNGKNMGTFTSNSNFRTFSNLRLLVTPKKGSTLYVGDVEIYGGNVCEPLTMNVNKLAEPEVMNAIDAYKAKNLITLPEAYDSIGAEKKSSIAQGLKSKTWATDDEIVTYITCAISENELVPVSDVTEEGILKSAVFAINKDDITLTAASAIFASYDADDTLIGVSVKELTNTSFARYGKISVSDIGLDVKGAAKVKYMLWAGIDTQTPLAVSTVK
ncbi:MAG: hypothetical protein SOW78_07950 [Clostridia bacterium]|nr:hypothetical protein [Clostridia bacterium]